MFKCFRVLARRRSKLSVNNELVCNTRLYFRRAVILPISNRNRMRDSAVNLNVLSGSDISRGHASRCSTDKMNNLLKSEYDSMEYRLIQLENGLKALLISDVQNIINLDELTDEDFESECENDIESPDTRGSTGSHSDNDDDLESRLSKQQAEEKMAACSLCIGVGSFSDPPEIPGLAHFLEHMVFMGSEKHPQENGFDEFVKRHGGSDNGSTDCEVTSFYLECSEQFLQEGMDRFAQFFISPLMRKDAMTREREIIQSEFDMALPSDESRRWQILASFTTPGHPAGKFFWGNLITLRDNIDDDTLYEKVHEFRKRYYSAHLMTVAVQGRLPLDTLETYVRESFSAVPTNDLPPDDFSQFSNSFGPIEDWNKLLWVKPVKDICQIHLTWVLPSFVNEYKSRPLDYLGWLIEHEGGGSLLSYLSQKVWALECSAGNEETGFEHNSIYSLFSIALTLTEEGFRNLKEVLEAVFSYLAMLKVKCPDKNIFDELESICRTNFRFKTEIPAVQYVEILSESMHFYEPDHYIAGGELYLEYRPDLITDVLNRLTPDTVNIVVYSRTVNDQFYDRTEPWFQTLYKVVDIPEDWKSSWRNVEGGKEFHIPDPNPYLTTNFTILEKPKKNPPFPVKIIDDSILEIWYRQDVKFNRPLAYYSFYVLSPLMKVNALNAAMLDVLLAFFDVKFVGKIYPANEAELYYSNAAADLGVYLQFSGYNQKLPLLFEEVLRLINKYLKEINKESNKNLIDAIIKEKSRFHYNRFLRPEKLVKMARLSLLVDHFWTSVERRSVMHCITQEQLSEFGNEFFRNVTIQGLIQGNISEEEARNLCSNFQSILNFCAITGPRPVISVANLERGEKYLRLKSFNENDSNSVITNYYQVGPATIRTSCILNILMMLMEEPLFDNLRTKQQIGYDVHCLLRDTFGVLAFSITIYFQSYKFNADEVDARVEAFLVDFLKTLRSMSKKELEETKKALCVIKSSADLQLNDEVKRNFSEICANEYVFDRLQKEVKVIPEIDHKEICTWFENHIACGPNYKKLSVQVIGPAKPTGKEQTVEGKEDFKMILLTSNGPKKDAFITDIEAFKAARTFHPQLNKLK
ncbi:UNVERIFIED_CONTAM: hypothetical protein PYX00_006388 [Menopon gallinae]|uniref:Nardilysin n=1 Tax=Menopon gallinae TaxID=328185 RepID=A0AAW2HVZ7_9NEOP